MVMHALSSKNFFTNLSKKKEFLYHFLWVVGGNALYFLPFDFSLIFFFNEKFHLARLFDFLGAVFLNFFFGTL